jgi:hypothetical protein
MYRVLLPLYLALPAVAAADETAPDPGAEERPVHYEINFRGRLLSVPKTVLDIWFTDGNDPGWALPQGAGPINGRDVPATRPKIKAYSLGLEFVVKNQSANGLFYFDYLVNQTGDGYWDDRDDYMTDGDYLEPTRDLGMIAFGANYAYEAHIVKTEKTNGAFGLSFLVGGGLGVGILTGKMLEWNPVGATPAYDVYLTGVDNDAVKPIPPVLPMVDVNAGLRFNFGDRAVLRVEGGLHTLVYYGATLGIMF